MVACIFNNQLQYYINSTIKFVIAGRRYFLCYKFLNLKIRGFKNLIIDSSNKFY